MLKNDMLVRDGESQGRAYRSLKVKFFVAFLVMLLPLTLASETQHRLKVYVKVAGAGDNKHAVNTVESHLKRELREESVSLVLFSFSERKFINAHGMVE